MNETKELLQKALNIADKPYIKQQFKDKSFRMLKSAVCKLYDCLKVKSRKEAIMYPVWITASDIQEKNNLTSNSNCQKVCKNDGFVWFGITADQARKLWKANVFTLYVLYDDDSEGMIDSEEKLENCIRRDCSIGIEVGFLSEMYENYEIIATSKQAERNKTRMGI